MADPQSPFIPHEYIEPCCPGCLGPPRPPEQQRSILVDRMRWWEQVLWKLLGRLPWPRLAPCRACGANLDHIQITGIGEELPRACPACLACLACGAPYDDAAHQRVADERARFREVIDTIAAVGARMDEHRATCAACERWHRQCLEGTPTHRPCPVGDALMSKITGIPQ